MFVDYPRPTIIALLALAALLAVLWTGGSAPAYAATFTVTNTNDSGDSSLRQAILDANVAVILLNQHCGNIAPPGETWEPRRPHCNVRCHGAHREHIDD